MIKYIVHPGYVISKIDGDRCWVSSSAFMSLYDVNPKECVVTLSSLINRCRIQHNNVPEIIHLFPCKDGKYKKRKNEVQTLD